MTATSEVPIFVIAELVTPDGDRMELSVLSQTNSRFMILDIADADEALDRAGRVPADLTYDEVVQFFTDPAQFQADHPKR